MKPWRRIRRTHSSKESARAVSRPPKAKPGFRKALRSSSDRARRVSAMGGVEISMVVASQDRELGLTRCRT